MREQQLPQQTNNVIVNHDDINSTLANVKCSRHRKTVEWAKKNYNRLNNEQENDLFKQNKMHRQLKAFIFPTKMKHDLTLVCVRSLSGARSRRNHSLYKFCWPQIMTPATYAQPPNKQCYSALPLDHKQSASECNSVRASMCSCECWKLQQNILQINFIVNK